MSMRGTGEIPHTQERMYLDNVLYQISKDFLNDVLNGKYGKLWIEKDGGESFFREHIGKEVTKI